MAQRKSQFEFLVPAAPIIGMNVATVSSAPDDHIVHIVPDQPEEADSDLTGLAAPQYESDAEDAGVEHSGLLDDSTDMPASPAFAD